VEQVLSDIRDKFVALGRANEKGNLGQPISKEIFHERVGVSCQIVGMLLRHMGELTYSNSLPVKGCTVKALYDMM